MKCTFKLLTVSLLLIGFTSVAQAQVRVAEKAAQMFSSASRAEQVWVNIGLGGLPATQRVSQLNAMVARGDAGAQAFARQLRIFEEALRAGANIEQAFAQAFVRAGEVLNTANIHKFAASSSEATASVISGALMMETSQDRAAQVPACGNSVLSRLDSADAASLNASLRVIEASNNGNAFLGDGSCAIQDLEMAKAVVSLAKLTESEILVNSQTSLADNIVAAYSKHMGVDRTTAVKNLKQLQVPVAQQGCGIISSNIVF